MAWTYSDTLEKNNRVGSGGQCIVYTVSPNIVVKVFSGKVSKPEWHPFRKEIAFYKSFNERQDRCLHIVECFLALPDHLFLSYCVYNQVVYRFNQRQERETHSDGFPGRLIRVKDYEDPALIAQWIQQIASALEYVEKMGFSHNDVHPRNCLLDQKLNMKLADFDHADTIGQFLEDSRAPWAITLIAGPLKGTFGLCGARTEQFALGTLLYYMVYGHEPYEDIDLEEQNPEELNRRFSEMEFQNLTDTKFSMNSSLLVGTTSILLWLC